MGQQFGAGDDDGLAEERSGLGSSDVEDVAQACDVGERRGGSVGGQRIGEPCAVEVERDGTAPADGVEFFQLFETVQCPEFGGVRDIEHSGSDHVGPGLVAVERVDEAFDVAGPNLAVVLGQGEDLVSGGLDCPGLVDVDVGRFGGQHPFVAAQQSVDDGGVGLGAARQEVDLGSGGLALPADELPGMGRVGVAAVTGSLFEVGLDEAAHHFGMRALHVVAVEMEHLSGLFCGQFRI